MHPWNPPANVGANEYIGRRLFDEPMLSGANDQNSFEGLSVNHFKDNRANDWSVDRLGDGRVDKAIANNLCPKAQKKASEFKIPKRFDGWATIRVGKLLSESEGKFESSQGTDLKVVASPDLGEGDQETSELTANPYHAHVLVPSENVSLLMALQLRYFFTHFGGVEPADD